MVAVQKKINTKIYDVSRPSKAENPPAGTILDHSVTLRDYYDYYLVPMNVNQGTVSPTHFVVLAEIRDSGNSFRSFFSPNSMKLLLMMHLIFGMDF